MTERDPLREGLQALESDLLHVRLAGPESARRRGRQRIRRQAASVAGALAIVAGAVLLGPIDSMLGTDGSPSPVSPATRFDATPPTAASTPTPAHTLTDDVLLDATDLVPADGGWQAIDTVWGGNGPFACAPGGAEDAGDVLLRSFVPSDEGRVDQVVERFDSRGDAEARFDEIRAAVAECSAGLDVKAGGPPEFWRLAGVGDAAWIAGYWTAENDGELRRRIEVGVVWTGTVVTHVTWGYLTPEASGPVVTPVTVAATENLCGPAAGACVSNPSPEPETEALEPAP